MFQPVEAAHNYRVSEDVSLLEKGWVSAGLGSVFGGWELCLAHSLLPTRSAAQLDCQLEEVLASKGQ